MEQPRWCAVATFTEPQGAASAAATLELAGIPARVDASASTLLPDVVRVSVAEGDADDAHAMLDRLWWRRSAAPGPRSAPLDAGGRDPRTALVLLSGAAAAVLGLVLAIV